MEHSEAKELYMVSCDWFQYFCVSGFRVPQINTYVQGVGVNPRGYRSMYFIKSSSEVMQGYKIRMGVYLHNYMLATIAVHPTNQNIRRDGAAVKVANRLLYTQDWSFYVHDIIASLGWQIRNITRIDLCYDCNYFYSHLHPQSLIQSYLNPQIAGLTQSNDEVSVITKKNVEREVRLAHRSFIRKGSNRFAVEGVKALHTPIFEYLRFGSRKSSVCAYIYNKSQELRVKKSKPYITECWYRVGLDTTEVYRVEISINSSGQWLKDKKIKVKADGNHNKVLAVDDEAFMRLDGRAIATQERLEEMFFTYAAEYFSFHIDTGQRYVKDMPKVKLFESSRVVTMKPVHINRNLDCGRAEKMVANHLDKLQESFPWLDTNQRISLLESSKIFAEISGLKRMKHKEDIYIDKVLLPHIDENLHKRMREYLHLKGVEFKSASGVVEKILEFMDHPDVLLVEKESEKSSCLDEV